VGALASVDEFLEHGCTELAGLAPTRVALGGDNDGEDGDRTQ